MDDDATNLADLQWKAEFLAMAQVAQEEGVQIFLDDEETGDAPDADHVGTDGDPYDVCSGDAYGEDETDVCGEHEVQGLTLDSDSAICEDADVMVIDDVEEVTMGDDVEEDDGAAAGEEDDVDDAFFFDTAGQQQQTDADTSAAGIGELPAEDGVPLEEAREVFDDQDAAAEENLLHADEEEYLEQQDELEEGLEQPEHDEIIATIDPSIDMSGSLDEGYDDQFLDPECSGASTLDNEPELAHVTEGSDAGEVVASDGAFFPLLQIAASANPEHVEQDADLPEEEQAAVEEDAVGADDLLDIEEQVVGEQDFVQEEHIDQVAEHESDAIDDIEEQVVGEQEFMQEEYVDELAEQVNDIVVDPSADIAGVAIADDHLGEQGNDIVVDPSADLAGVAIADDHLGEDDTFVADMSESQLDFAAPADDAELPAVVDDDAVQVEDAADAGADFHEALDDLPEEDAGEIDNCEAADAEVPSYGLEEVADGENPDAASGVDVEAGGSEEALDSDDPSATVRTGNENGYVFLCNNRTQNECANLKLLGSPDKEFDHMKHTIKQDTQLFLFNFQSWKLLGPFVAIDEPKQNIVPSAFMRRFSAQVRVVPVGPLCETKISTRLESGMKTADEVMALMDSLLNAGAASDAIQKAWSVEATDEPPAKKLKLGGEVQSNGAHTTSLMMPKPKRAAAPKPDSSSLIRPVGRGSGAGAVFLSRARSDGTVDENGRPFNLRQVVVNFANVGASFAEKVLGRDSRRNDRMFDWEGVRRCVYTLTEEQGMQVIGVLFENFKGPDNDRHVGQGVPADIRRMCTFIQETPRLTGRNHKSADDEVTIKCAFRRNCRFLDNDNYRDWLNHMSNEKVRIWLENRQELLQMRYFFDAQMGTFDTLDGNIPAGVLASGET